MLELTPFLKKLISLPGLSGHEQPVLEVIREAWQPLVDEISVSPVGSLHGLRRGSRGDTTAAPRPRILLSAHMDAIGMMVTGIVEGFLRITDIGGIDPRVLPGQPVTVHGREDLPGVVLQPPDRLLPPRESGRPVDMNQLFIDTGLLPQEVNRLVRVGDLVSYAQVPVDLAGDAMAGHTMDDRVAVVAVTLCLQELAHISHAWDVWAVASVQEEVTMAGALTSPFSIRPDMGIAIDVTFGKGPGASDWRTFPLDKGFTLGWGPNIHPALFKAFKDLAERLDIPYETEVMPHHSGTDAFGMQIVAEGIPTMVIGIPLRYMHTPVEEVYLKNISRTGHLLAQFIAHLELDFISKIQWDGEKP
jgi:tetrahedral aminopeptidase